MHWIALVVAGLMEIGFAVSLKASDGFTRLVPSLSFAAFGAVSFVLLAWSMRALPVGSAYAVWTGIGAAGTAIVGVLALGESTSAVRLAGIAAVVLGVVLIRLGQ